MLKVNSIDWKNFISKLEIIKTKSNREVLCIHCWQMLNCKQKIKHLKKFQDHEKYLLTSTKYASEKQILSLAKTQNKLFSYPDGDYVLTPYGPLNRQFREQANNFMNEEYKMVDIGFQNNQNLSAYQPQNFHINQFQVNPMSSNSIAYKHPFEAQLNSSFEQYNLNEKIFSMNCKLDQILKILQILFQQDPMANQNMNQYMTQFNMMPTLQKANTQIINGSQPLNSQYGVPFQTQTFGSTIDGNNTQGFHRLNLQKSCDKIQVQSFKQQDSNDSKKNDNKNENQISPSVQTLQSGPSPFTYIPQTAPTSIIKQQILPLYQPQFQYGSQNQFQVVQNSNINQRQEVDKMVLQYKPQNNLEKQNFQFYPQFTQLKNDQYK